MRKTSRKAARAKRSAAQARFKILKRWWQRRWIRRSVWMLVIVLALIGLAWEWTNFSGSRQWSETRTRLSREGQTLDFRAICPDPIPDAENFCAIPLLKDLALVIDGDPHKGEPGQERERLTAVINSYYRGKPAAPPVIAGATLGQRTDLKHWSAWLTKDSPAPAQSSADEAPRDVLAALAGQDEVFGELVAGLNRPLAQWTPAWKTRALPRNLQRILLPHLYGIPLLIRFLGLRGIAAARAGDPVKAHECLQIMARLDEACLREPFLTGVLDASHGVESIADATWELCDAHAGTAEDFRRLESALAAMDFRVATARAASSELITNVSAFQFFKEYPDEFLDSMGRGMNSAHSYVYTPLNRIVMRVVPPGLFDSNTAVYADRALEYSVRPIRDRGWRAALLSARQLRDQLIHAQGGFLSHPSSDATYMYCPATLGIPAHMIYSQTVINQATIACALERYRIEKGSYPESLDDVKLADGKPLPVELLTGKPMSYRRTSNGKYALWSSSFDEKNHGGQRVLDKKNPEKTRFKSEDYAGDWVWDFAEE
jgi:hypothetical protein